MKNFKKLFIIVKLYQEFILIIEIIRLSKNNRFVPSPKSI